MRELDSTIRDRSRGIRTLARETRSDAPAGWPEGPVRAGIGPLLVRMSKVFELTMKSRSTLDSHDRYDRRNPIGNRWVVSMIVRERGGVEEAAGRVLWKGRYFHVGLNPREEDVGHPEYLSYRFQLERFLVVPIGEIGVVGERGEEDKRDGEKVVAVKPLTFVSNLLRTEISATSLVLGERDP